MLHIIWSIIIGFIIGLIARAIMPGAQHLGFIMTTLLGIGGSIVGGLDRPVVFQTGARCGVSSGRFHHVDHWRNNSALYLDKISGLTKSIRTLGEETSRVDCALDVPSSPFAVVSAYKTKVPLLMCLAFVKPLSVNECSL